MWRSAIANATSDSTLLIDLNVAFGDAAVFLGEEPRFSVMDALEHVQRLDEAFFRGLIVKTKSGLELLGASGKPVTGIFDATRIRALLDFASHTRRITVLDVPRSDTAALDSLELATKIVLVANQELATVRNASRMAATLRQRYGSERINLVLTRTDRRAEIGHEDIQRTVGINVRHTFPSDYRLALQAMNKGRPGRSRQQQRARDGVCRVMRATWAASASRKKNRRPGAGGCSVASLHVEFSNRRKEHRCLLLRAH